MNLHNTNLRAPTLNKSWTNCTSKSFKNNNKLYNSVKVRYKISYYPDGRDYDPDKCHHPYITFKAHRETSVTLQQMGSKYCLPFHPKIEDFQVLTEEWFEGGNVEERFYEEFVGPQVPVIVKADKELKRKWGLTCAFKSESSVRSFSSVSFRCRRWCKNQSLLKRKIKEGIKKRTVCKTMFSQSRSMKLLR